MIAEIRRSRFLVADFTRGRKDVRGSVYDEAGFVHGARIPVTFTAEDGTEPHFDTSTYPPIFWERNDLATSRKNLTDRILALDEIGEGHLGVSPRQRCRTSRRRRERSTRGGGS